MGWRQLNSASGLAASAPSLSSRWAGCHAACCHRLWTDGLTAISLYDDDVPARHL
jgi:hypothetical protein